MSEAINLSIDSKGRINISKDIIVDIFKKTVLFVGKEIIRSQDLFAKHLEECKQIAGKKLQLLKW